MVIGEDRLLMTTFVGPVKRRYVEREVIFELPPAWGEVAL
jgi:hypothetical protein